MPELKDPVTNIKGIGEKTAALFRKLGIETVEDLIYDFPRDYKIYSGPVPVRDIAEGDRVAVFCTIVTRTSVYRGGRYVMVSVSGSDATGTLRLVWYNMPFLRGVFHKGDRYVFVGRVKIRGRERILEMPEYYTREKYLTMQSSLQPVYTVTAGLSTKTIAKSVAAVKELILSLPDPLDPETRQQYGLMPRNEAVFAAHFPADQDTLKMAVRRLAFDEFLDFLLHVKELRVENATLPNHHRITKEAVQALPDFLDSLPFQLTPGQREAVEDMQKDMASPHVMNRLLQGDVGSGKTVVAAAALFLVLCSGWQGVIMVPTEVLARQHYADFCRMFAPWHWKVDLLTGSVGGKERSEMLRRIDSGESRLIIGTQALIQDRVHFHDVGLAVTDEQHRFGVRQRENLKEKGNSPHQLVMSATPIPRTLAIILYADLDLSVIRELPAGRKKIKNTVVGTEYRPAAYAFIRKQVKMGHQAYVVCPMIAESSELDAENVTDYSENLKKELGPGVRVTSLNGRMKDGEKDEILAGFAAHRWDVLVSTTVIEVGINVPNATVMMVENAERFGLAELHQLRGRVGRGDAQSYCIFINVKKTEISEKRLKVLEDSDDGFYIASQDLKLRGPGEFFGLRQSGAFSFRFADIYRDADLLDAAREVSLRKNTGKQAGDN